MRAVGAATFWMDAPRPSAADVEPLRSRRVPLLLAAAWFAAGIGLARTVWHTPLELAVACGSLLLLAGLALRFAPRVAGLPVLALWATAGCWCAGMQSPVPRQAELLRFADGLSRTVRGRVVQVRPLNTRVANAAAPLEPSEPWLAEPGAWEAEAAPARESVDLQVEAVEDLTPDTSALKPVAGGVRVTVTGDPPALGCGTTVELPLRLREPDVYRDPGAWSQSDFLLLEGIGVLGSAKGARIRVLDHPLPASPGTRTGVWRQLEDGLRDGTWACRLHSVQRSAAARLLLLEASAANQRLPRAARLTPEDTAVLAAMLFGDRTGLSRTLRTGFERTGTFHLFVVSGLHVALLAGGLLWLLRRARTPYWAAVLLSLLLTTGYALLTGWGVPVQRALGMTALYLLARLLAREASPLNALGAAAVAVLALDPRALFAGSFQMTFLVIFAVAGLAAPIEQRSSGPVRRALRELAVIRLDAWMHPRLAALRVRLRMWSDLLAALASPPPAPGGSAGTEAGAARTTTVTGQEPRLAVSAGVQGWVARLLSGFVSRLPVGGLRVACAVWSALLLGLVTECCMVLPMAVYFHRATLLALPVNLVCLPLVGVLLVMAIATFLLTLVSAKLAVLPAAGTALLLHAVRALVGYMGRARLGDVRVPGPALPALLAAGAALLWALWALRARSRALVWAGLAAVAALPLLALWPEPPLLHPGALEVTAIDVGQGDSLLVVSPVGRTLLVDAGGPVGQAPSADRWDIGEEIVAPYLWSRRIRRLDAVLLTHAHSDHMGGMPAVLRDLRPRELWLGVQPDLSPALLALRQEAAELGIAVRWFRAGDGFAWGGLDAQVLAPERGYSNAGPAINDDSLVMRFAYGSGSVLLEGDAQSRSEAAMLAQGRVRASTLLKVGHHGSKTSTTPEFLQAVAPREAVVSVGRHNTFGHPRTEVLARLQAAGVRTFRTDRGGLETFLIGSDGSITALPATAVGQRP